MTHTDYSELFGGSSEPNRPGFAQRFAREQAPAPAPDGNEQSAGSGAYKPYGFMPAGFGESCDVRRWMDATEIAEGIEFQYRFLMQIGYVGDEQIKLFLPDCIVVVEGRALRDLRKKLARRQATFIQQFSPMVWSSPPVHEALVTSVSVLRTTGDARARERGQ